jgi:hypothetical protein
MGTKRLRLDLGLEIRGREGIYLKLNGDHDSGNYPASSPFYRAFSLIWTGFCRGLKTVQDFSPRCTQVVVFNGRKPA